MCFKTLPSLAESHIFLRKGAGGMVSSLVRVPGKSSRGVAFLMAEWRRKWRNGGKKGGIHGGIARFGWRNGGAESTMADGRIPRGQPPPPYKTKWGGRDPVGLAI